MKRIKEYYLDYKDEIKDGVIVGLAISTIILMFTNASYVKNN